MALWEVANCSPTYRGSMSDPSIEWERCKVLSDMSKRPTSWDVEIVSDGARCNNVNRRYIREVDVKSATKPKAKVTAKPTPKAKSKTPSPDLVKKSTKRVSSSGQPTTQKAKVQKPKAKAKAKAKVKTAATKSTASRDRQPSSSSSSSSSSPAAAAAPQTIPATHESLIKSITHAVDSIESKYTVSGVINTSATVKFLGGAAAITFPLSQSAAEQQLPQLLSSATTSPFGHGNQTLVDSSVRSAHHLLPSEFEIDFDPSSSVTTGLPASICVARGVTTPSKKKGTTCPKRRSVGPLFSGTPSTKYVK